MNSNIIKAHAAVLAVNVIYGGNFLIVKNVVPEFLPPIALTFFRAVGSTILLWLLGLFLPKEKIERGDYIKLIISGLIGVSINQSLLIMSLKYTSSVNASIISTLSPVCVMIISAFLLKYPITLVKFVGVMLGAVGALLVITSGGEFNFDSDTFVGDLIILANTIIFAFYLVYTKPLMAKYSPMTVMRWSFLFGTIVVIFIGLPDVIATDFAAMPVSAYLSIGYVVFFATFLTYWLNVVGLRYINPTTVSFYIYAQPLVVAILSAILGINSLSVLTFVAMALVFSGVYLVNKSNKI